ncbi:hypothetical protein D3C81_1714180 [compost metagenome]
MVDDRRAEEGGVALLAGLGEVAEARVAGGVLEVERLLAGTDQADQALARGHADLADGVLVEALGGHQHEAVALRIEQVHRADLGAHGCAHALDDDRQGGVQIPGGVDLLDDLAQRVEHGQRGVAPSSSRWSGGGGQSRSGRRGASSFRARRYTSRLKETTWPSGYQ